MIELEQVSKLKVLIYIMVYVYNGLNKIKYKYFIELQKFVNIKI